jgi:hypothetical protein
MHIMTKRNLILSPLERYIICFLFLFFLYLKIVGAKKYSKLFQGRLARVRWGLRFDHVSSIRYLAIN